MAFPSVAILQTSSCFQTMKPAFTLLAAIDDPTVDAFTPVYSPAAKPEGSGRNGAKLSQNQKM